MFLKHFGILRLKIDLPLDDVELMEVDWLPEVLVPVDVEPVVPLDVD